MLKAILQDEALIADSYKAALVGSNSHKGLEIDEKGFVTKV